MQPLLKSGHKFDTMVMVTQLLKVMKTGRVKGATNMDVMIWKGRHFIFELNPLCLNLNTLASIPTHPVK